MKNTKRLLALSIAACLTFTSVFTGNYIPAVYATDNEQIETETYDEEKVATTTEAMTESLETAVEAPTEADTEEETQAGTEDTYTEETPAELPVDTYNYYGDSTSATTLSFADIVIKDEAGNIVDPGAVITHAYNRSTPIYSLYYNDIELGNTNYSSYCTITLYKYNSATGTYDSVYADDVEDAGSYQIVLQGNGQSRYNYYNGGYYLLPSTESLTLNITITPKDLNDADIICSAISDQTFMSEPLYPSFTVKYQKGDDYYDSYTLVPDIVYEYDEIYDPNTGKYVDTYQPVTNSTYDYTVQYVNNTSAGLGIIRITGVGNYTGTRDITFNIFADVSTLVYSGFTDQPYTGQAITFPGFTACEGTKVLTPGVDYSIAYSNNTDYGEATITVTGMGYYTGTYDVYFGIVPKKVTGIKSSSPKKLQAKLTWYKCKGADGFEIARYNSKKKTYEVIALMGDGNWQVYQDAASSLKNNVTYKYRIRPYVCGADKSRRYYGPAATKKCKVTKAYKELNIPIYTGCADVDYAAEVICKKVIKKGMSQQQKVKALYDWTVDHCTHDKDYGKHKTVYSYSKNKKKAKAYNTKIWKQIYTGKADCNFDGFGYSDSNYYYDYYSEDYEVMFPQRTGWVNGKGGFDRTYVAFQTHKGGCSYITRLFKALINHAGLECTLVDGNYVNRDGSRMYHYWCFIRVNKKYAWYDVDVATSNKRVRYVWYKKGAKFWHTCHDWDPKYNEDIPSYLN